MLIKYATRYYTGPNCPWKGSEMYMTAFLSSVPSLWAWGPLLRLCREPCSDYCRKIHSYALPLFQFVKNRLLVSQTIQGKKDRKTSFFHGNWAIFLRAGLKKQWQNWGTYNLTKSFISRFISPKQRLFTAEIFILTHYFILLMHIHFSKHSERYTCMRNNV